MGKLSIILGYFSVTLCSYYFCYFRKKRSLAQMDQKSLGGKNKGPKNSGPKRFFFNYKRPENGTKWTFALGAVPRMAEAFLAAKQGFPYMAEYLNWPNLNWPNLNWPIFRSRLHVHLPARSDHPSALATRSDNPLDPFSTRPFLST